MSELDEAILLGTAQDGGVPQAGCHCALCTQPRTDPALRQWVACLGLVDHAARQCWLIDTTPDSREQLSALHSLAPDCPLAGILLTHTPVGHYTGLIHLGREA
jgi:pyrroloquinoline quinone biosynthesis protein B